MMPVFQCVLSTVIPHLFVGHGAASQGNSPQLNCDCAFDNRERYREQYITVYRMTTHAEHLPAMKTKPKFIFFTDFVRHFCGCCD